MFNPLHSISNEELFKKHLYNPRKPKERNLAMHPNHINYRLKSEVSITLHCRLHSTRYTAVRIKNCLKSTSAIKIATMKNTADFRFEGKPSSACAKSTPFPVSKDEWDIKEDTGKSMKNALYVLRYANCGMPKRTCRAEATSKSEKIKPVALAVIELHLSEGISQSVTYSVSRKFH